MTDAVAERPANAETARIIYILYLVGIVAQITTLVGLVMAYINKEEAPDWLKSHYQLLIRTFWIGLLYVVIVSVLCTILIGFLLIPVLLVWWILRCVKGLKQLEKREAYPNPTAWGF